MAHALLNPSRPPLRARAEAAHVGVRSLVDGDLAHVERVDVDVGTLDLRVRDRARDELLHERRAGLVRELEKLQSLLGVASADEVHHHPRLTRANALESCFGAADHDDSFPKDPSAPGIATLRRDTDIRQEGARLISLTRQPETGPHRALLLRGWPNPNQANSWPDTAKGRPN